MSVLSMVMLIASIFFLYLVIRNINKNNILFEQAFMWIVISLVMIIISIFDAIPVYFAELLGFELTSNFLLSLAIFFLLVITFLQTLTVSKQKEQIKHLVQELSILKSKSSRFCFILSAKLTDSFFLNEISLGINP